MKKINFLPHERNTMAAIEGLYYTFTTRFPAFQFLYIFEIKRRDVDQVSEFTLFSLSYEVLMKYATCTNLSALCVKVISRKNCFYA